MNKDTASRTGVSHGSTGRPKCSLPISGRLSHQANGSATKSNILDASGDLPHPSRCEEPRVIARRTPSAAMDKISHGPVGPRNLVWGAMIVQQKTAQLCGNLQPNSSLPQRLPNVGVLHEFGGNHLK